MYSAYCTLIMDRFIHLQPTPTIIYEGGLTMNKPTRMKILVFLLVFWMVAAFLPACAEEPAPPTPTPTTEPTQPTEPTEPQPVDAADLLAQIDIFKQFVIHCWRKHLPSRRSTKINSCHCRQAT